MRSRSTLPLVLVTSWLIPASGMNPAIAEPEPANEVTLERIMADPDWLGRPPESPYWAADGSAVYFERKRAGSELRDLFRQPVGGGEPQLVGDAERNQADGPGGDWSADRRRKVYLVRGDVFLRDLDGGTVRQLTRTPAPELEPRFLIGDSAVAFLRGGAFFRVELETGLESLVADLRLEDDPEKEKPPTYLTEQQQRLFQILRKQKERKAAAAARTREELAANPAWSPRPFYLGKGKAIGDLSLSPAGDRLIVALTADEPDEGKGEAMAAFVTASGYVESREVRPLVGTGHPASDEVILLDLQKLERHDLDLSLLPGAKDDPLRELREKAKAKKAAVADEGDKKAAAETKAGDKEAVRQIDLRAVAWSEDGREALLAFFALDNKDRWLATVDFEKAALSPRHRLTDSAWINWDFHEAGFLRDGRTLWYLSEETGYSRLYRLPLAPGSQAEALSAAGSTADRVTLSPDGRFLYFRANPSHPGAFDVFRVPVEGGPVQRVTSVGGLVEYELSGDGSALALRHSKALVPPEIYVQDAVPGASARALTATASAEFRAIEWSAPEYVAVPSTHGAGQPIHSRVYVPPGFDPDRAEKYPAVLFVHGAGYLQNAHQGWSGYFREFMFHTFLARAGYVVLDMDYRASAGYGRNWRTAIYRRMGTPELEDFEDGIAWLVAERAVDPERIGIYGGSYGGFMTLMGLFKRPGLFAAGAALRPVTDWAHYNHEYTSNILNTPELDPEAYATSSPIEHAAGLADPLLLIHGMQDDNVFFQDTVRLAQVLIELKKQDWEVALYPIEPHGFREPSSWLDAYRRIFKLFEREVRGVRGVRGVR